ncbi:hypothetical protein GCM10027160_35420 [Streptomyces calidiresistens]|uniref:DLW-39 family protein n=1 Tax=Streptomyces calidiresistens TaxID=1485586 RepID=UPI0015FE3BA1|nr:DLW-39 family protein [Streptomyces calidiresistens]
MKKLLLVALVAAGGILVYRQIQQGKAEQDLWTDATDPVPGDAVPAGVGATTDH